MKNFEKSFINFAESHLFSPLFISYEENKMGIEEFYEVHYKDKQQTAKKIEQILDGFKTRDTLKTYISSLPISSDSSVENNRKLLLEDNTLTVCTGHQLCLLTGPLYFVYKILSTIKLAEYYKSLYPTYHFVPVYWMAGEDNDKDEINHFNSFHERIEWETNQTGAVGHYHLSGLADVLSKYFDSIGNHEMNKLAIKSLIETTFNASNTLSDFTYHLVSELFKDKGLIILNPDNVQFKAAFSPFIKKDIFEQINYTAVVSTIEKLENKGFIKKGKAQVHPREINFFYLDTQYRERIVFDGSQYQTIDKKFTWKNEELINEIDSNPQKFSPNVVTRPLYQQFIIPNLAYIGGPGEIAYWLEYKEAFRLNNIQMPVLVPRKFIYVIEKNYADKMEKLEIDLLQIFQLTVDELKTNWIANKNITQIDLSEYQLKFNELFDLIQNQVIPIDKTLSSYIEAERTKTIGFIQNLESKTLRALKRSEESSLQQIEKLKNRLFPKLIPQERHFNIFNYLLKYDFLFIEDIYESINYDEGGILILTEK